MSFTQEELNLISAVKGAIKATIESQIDSLKNGRVERNFTTYLATNIKNALESPDTLADPFYNKHLGASKRLGDKLIELDIAVHTRGTDENNLVAIELETVNKPTRDDVWKIQGLTNPLGGYGYKVGLYLVVGIEDRAGEIIALEWYKNANPLKI
jgi:hypothetical protein